MPDYIKVWYTETEEKLEQHVLLSAIRDSIAREVEACNEDLRIMTLITNRLLTK